MQERVLEVGWLLVDCLCAPLPPSRSIPVPQSFQSGQGSSKYLGAVRTRRLQPGAEPAAFKGLFLLEKPVRCQPGTRPGREVGAPGALGMGTSTHVT